MVFEGFVVPDPLVTGALLVAVLAVGLLLLLVRPTVSQWVVLAAAPWMVLGALLHAVYQLHRATGETLLPDPGAVLLSAPAVYLTTFALAGLVWVLAARLVDDHRGVTRLLAGTGAFLLVPAAGYATLEASGEFALEPVLPVVGLLGSLALTGLVALLLTRWRPTLATGPRVAGLLVLFAHTFDGITTGIGVELLDAGERSTAPRVILDIAAGLPTADLLGEAWLFVLVKLSLAAAIVVGFHDYAAEEPTEGNLFFAGIAAIGLGPGAHNFFLFLFGI
jgi:uncharacterized membrane protein